MSETPAKEIKLDDVLAAGNTQAFLAARSIAIQEYANLEQALCLLFAHLSGTTNQIAGIIFFRLTNAASRLAIIDKLMRLKYGDAHRLFFNSLVAVLKPFDGKRNEIVHWHGFTTIDLSADPPAATVQLGPPNFWDHNENTPALTLRDLTEFSAKADFLARLVNVFAMTALVKVAPLDDTWRDIFAQPLAYPPPDGHPGIRPPKTPKDQP